MKPFGDPSKLLGTGFARIARQVWNQLTPCDIRAWVGGGAWLTVPVGDDETVAHRASFTALPQDRKRLP